MTNAMVAGRMALHAVHAIIVVLVTSALAQRDATRSFSEQIPIDVVKTSHPRPAPGHVPSKLHPRIPLLPPHFNPPIFPPVHSPGPPSPDVTFPKYVPKPVYTADQYAGSSPLDELKAVVMRRIRRQTQQLNALAKFRSITLASIEKVSSLIGSWCRGQCSRNLRRQLASHCVETLSRFAENAQEYRK